MSTAQRKCKTNALEQLSSNATAVRPRFRPAKRTPASDKELTRDKGLVVLVGQKKAIAIAVRNGSGRRRWSKTNGFGSGGPAPHSMPRGGAAAPPRSGSFQRQTLPIGLRDTPSRLSDHPAKPVRRGDGCRRVASRSWARPIRGEVPGQQDRRGPAAAADR